MSVDGKGKKPRIFIKKNTDEDSTIKDEFYEYDKLRARENTLDESFFEDFESVDFEKVKYAKEHTPVEETKNEVFSSADMIEDEVIQEIADEEKEVLMDEKTADNMEPPVDDDSKVYEKVEVEEDDDDDFGSLESGQEDSVVHEVKEDIPLDKDEKENLDVENKIEDENSIFNQYGINNDEDLAKEGDYDSLFEKVDYINFENKLSEEDDDDDFGSLEDEPVYDKIKFNQTEYINVNQKSNYYKDLKDTDDEFESEYDDDDEEEYYINKNGKKKKKRGGFRIFLKFLLAFLLACSAIAVYFGLTHDLFKIDYINVIGNVANEKEILISKSGVSIGDNIFLASSNKIEKNLKSISNIESVKVRKNYPNILEIEVKENYVSAYINATGGLTTIDNYGKVKEVATDNSKASGIQIKGISETGLKVGDDFTKDISKVKFLLDILTKEYYSEVVSIDFTNDKEIVLELKNSLKITFGDLKDYAKKTQIIGILLKKIQLEGINAKEIILNVGNNPIIVKK